VNVTVSLPDDLVQRARESAVGNGMSLSKYVATVLERELNGGLTYEEAHQRFRKHIAEGPFLEVGKITWTRDELHDRNGAAVG
jgi:hypothetical protein